MACEHEVAIPVARGWTNKEVARESGVTDGTVKLHAHKIFANAWAKKQNSPVFIGRGGA
jgi:DNA-binding NarL/FixJ family response regulator